MLTAGIFATFVVLLVAQEAQGATALSRSKRDVSCRLHDNLCTYWCRLIGHSGGFCDIEDQCLCSEKALDEYVCSEKVGEEAQRKLCAGWCQLNGRQTGNCDRESRGCTCSGEKLQLKHAKCVSDTVCSMWCQIRERRATGTCQGEHNWECVCKSGPEDVDNEVIL